MENYNNELYHWGIKDMKWGIRRYQNKDGTLTDAGKKRYARDAREKEYNKYDESTGQYYKQSKKQGRQDLSVDANRYVTEDMQRTKSLADSGKNLSNELKRVTDKSIKNTPKTRLDLSSMTDKELRDRINRELLERQYNDVFNPPTVSKGKEYASKILETSSDVLAVTGSALAVALSIRALTGGKVN